MDPRREFMQAQYRTGRLVAFSVTTIVPLLGFVVWIMLSGPSTEGYTPVSESLGIAFGFAVVAAVAAGGSFLVGSLLIRSATANAQNGRFSPQVTEQVTENARDPLYAAVGAFWLADITAMALSEVPTLLGFTLTILTGQWFVYVAGAAVTVTLWSIHFPRMSRWERQLDAEEARLSGVPQIIRS